MRGSFRIPSPRHAVRFPEVESTEVNSCAGQSRPPGECVREGIPDLQVLQSQVGRTERGQCRRLIIPVSDAAVTVARIRSIGAIFVPGIAVIDKRGVSHKDTPWQSVVGGSVPYQRPCYLNEATE